MPQEKSSNQLRIRCRKHPRYNAIKPKKNCVSCSLIYILRYQYSKTPDKYLGGIDPYQFIGDLKEAAEGTEVWLDPKLKPQKISTIRHHYPSCPAFVDELHGCSCAQLRRE